MRLRYRGVYPFSAKYRKNNQKTNEESVNYIYTCWDITGLVGLSFFLSRIIVKLNYTAFKY